MSIAFRTNYLYTVQPGDTVYSLASQFGSTIQDIAQMNYLFPPVTEPYMIIPGQKLVIPTLAPFPTTFYTVAPGDSLFVIAERFSTTIDELTTLNPFIEDPNVIFPDQPLLVPALIYLVEPSDSIYKIATRFGIEDTEIIRANRDRSSFSEDVIWPGYALIIPHH